MANAKARALSPAGSVFVGQHFQVARVRVRTVAATSGHWCCGEVLRVRTVSGPKDTATALTGGSIRQC